MAKTKNIGRLSKWETPNSGTIDYDDVITVSLEYSGPYEELKADAPWKGTQISGYEGMTVSKAQLRRGKGLMGILTVQMTGNPLGASTDPLRITCEIDWQRIEKPLRQHPRYAPDGEQPIDPDEWNQLDQWEQQQDQSLRLAYCYVPVNKKDPVVLSDAQMDYAKKRLKGVESYIVFAPIVRKTGYYAKQPNTGDCGALEAPKVSVKVPEGWVWMKTADRPVEQSDRSWVRSEEWTGADAWDTDLYPVPKAKSVSAKRSPK